MINKRDVIPSSPSSIPHILNVSSVMLNLLFVIDKLLICSVNGVGSGVG
jgi:hypothetical protein